MIEKIIQCKWRGKNALLPVWKCKEENNFLRADVINYRVYGGKESTLKIYFAIDAMEELGVATVFRSSDEYRININKSNKKVDILDSVTLKRIKDF